MDCVYCLEGVLRKLNRLGITRFGIRLVEGRAGAGDGHANLVTPVEHVTYPADVELELVDLPGLQERLLLEAIAITCAPGVIANQNRAAVGIYIAYANDKIRVASR